MFVSRNAGLFASSMPKKPTPPTSLVATNPSIGQINLSWSAPVNTGFPAVTSYTVEVVGVTTINTGSTSTSYNWTGGTIGTSYVFKVYANNSAGQSNASNQSGSVSFRGVIATGGTETTYSSGGTNYKVHSFLSDGTFSITSTTEQFDVLLVGGGGGGGGQDGNFHGDGGSGGYDTQSTITIPVGSHAVTVGGGGGGGYGTWSYGGAGGTSSISSYASAAGGAGGNPAGVNGGNYSYGASNGGTSSLRNGSAVTYGSGGAPNNCGAYGGNNTGNGGGGGHTGRGIPIGQPGWEACGGGTGGTGIVVIRYVTA